MWSGKSLPYIAERFIGISIPHGDEMLAISYEGIHQIRLTDPITVTHYDEYPEGGDLYDWRHQVLRFGDQDHRVLGLYGGTPILKSPSGEMLRPLPQVERLQVLEADGSVDLDYQYRDLSGDWAAATFSTSHDVIVLALPYDLYVFRRC